MTQSSPSYDFDFAVAGGGPGGASAAIALARRGHRVVLLERERFPRFHIGESLISTANDAFDALGVTERIEAAGFPRKWGARLLVHDGSSGRTVDFTAARGVRRPQTFQVRRDEFDVLLLDRAREVGVEVREGMQVSGCEFTPDAALVDVAAGVAGGASGGSAGEGEAAASRLRVRALVDATGRHGLVARKLGLRRDEPLLANVAIYSHYTGVPRLGGDRPDDIRLVACSDAGWFGLIPVSGDLMSVGVVLPAALLRSRPAASNQERLERAIAATPVVAGLMKDARREWPVRAEKDFSYSSTAYAGHRWILVGDAGSFLDPVFSTGVSIAMESGLEAAAALDRAAASGDFSAGAFREFSRVQTRRFRVFRRFVVGFYTPEFRDRFFDPSPPAWIFRSVVTVLAGNWNPDRWTKLLAEVFFAGVALQRWRPRAGTRFRRDPEAGYPGA